MRNRLTLFALIFLSFYATLGYYPLFNLDEGAFSEATREMLQNHDFITTYLNGHLRFDKPILIYWLQAFSATIFGLNEFAMRLPSALAATGWAYLIYRFTKHHFDEEKAFLATLFMAGSLQISIIAKAAIADALLNLFIAASMFCYFTYTQTQKKRYLYFTFTAIALGTLTKGPVAIMIPLVVSFLYHIKNLRFWLRSVFDPLGLVIFLAVAAPWYIAEYLDQGQKFIDGFLLKHNLSRFGGRAMEGHKGPIFYYVVVLLAGLLPFTSIALKAISQIKEWFDTPLKRYLAIWFLFVFVFFSLSKTKLPHYVIYGYTPLFILMALYFERIGSKVLLLLPFWLFHTLFLILPVLKPFIVQHIKQQSYEYFIVDALHFGTGYIAYFIFALAASVVLLRTSKRTITIAMAFLTLVSLNLFIAKVYADAAEKPIKEAALFAKTHNLSVKMEGINTPSFNFYQGKITNKHSKIILTKRSNLKKYPDAKILYLKNGIVLLKEKE